jgi:8-oxo-dGTP pyrophosphatase MutT (NUDIX family)
LEVPIARYSRQYAALPVAERAGQLMVMLVTSRQTQRWIIPKGWPEKKLAPHALAAKEAYEEAGLTGEARRQPLGTYRYIKRLGLRKKVWCEVEVFLFDVHGQTDDWPEKDQRHQRWCTIEEAALLVDDAGLAKLLVELAAGTAESRAIAPLGPHAAAG